MCITSNTQMYAFWSSSSAKMGASWDDLKIYLKMHTD